MDSIENILKKTLNRQQYHINLYFNGLNNSRVLN
jgi:hypothetical protein